MINRYFLFLNDPDFTKTFISIRFNIQNITKKPLYDKNFFIFSLLIWCHCSSVIFGQLLCHFSNVIYCTLLSVLLFASFKTCKPDKLFIKVFFFLQIPCFCVSKVRRINSMTSKTKVLTAYWIKQNRKASISNY